MGPGKRGSMMSYDTTRSYPLELHMPTYSIRVSSHKSKIGKVSFHMRFDKEVKWLRGSTQANT